MFSGFDWGMWGRPQVKNCPGDGCQNRIFASQELCSGCKQKERVRKERDAEWGVHLWAIEGMKDMRVYLASWAAFEERHGPN